MTSPAVLLERIRQAVRDGRHRFSEHSLDELYADGLHPVDAEAALLTGRLTREDEDEPGVPGPRYTVIGTATDQVTMVGVVSRFEPQDQLIIITCYEIAP